MMGLDGRILHPPNEKRGFFADQLPLFPKFFKPALKWRQEKSLTDSRVSIQVAT
jgi:hypothetical protein